MTIKFEKTNPIPAEVLAGARVRPRVHGRRQTGPNGPFHLLETSAHHDSPPALDYRSAVPEFVSRGGLKLEHALQTFAFDVAGVTCADLGCSTGGFTDCMLQRGAAKVYAVDTGYGVLDWKLRKDPRVIVMERVNAMHVELPEKVRFISIDVAWTKQSKILPSAKRLLTPDGRVCTLIKPHYEADPKLLRKGVLPEETVASVVEETRLRIAEAGFRVLEAVESPIKGSKGNTEVLALLELA